MKILKQEENNSTCTDTSKIFVADFETTTNAEDCRVWLFSLTPIGNEENTIVGNDLPTFMQKLEEIGNATIYFHNLKFDSQFIIYYLLTHDYKHVDNTKKMPNKSFNTLISHLGVFYSMVIKIKPKVRIKFLDSYKKLPFPERDISEAFNIAEIKGNIDYHKERPIGYEPDDNEINYVMNDTIIVSKALNKQFKQGLDKMTIGSDALTSFKAMCDFEKLFPVLPIEIDDFIRKSYRGGWTYLNPKYTNKDLGNMEVYDINSLYPSRMRYCLVPYDEPIYYEGNYIPDEEYPLYIQHVHITFKLKDHAFPTVQDKKGFLFNSTEYITECLIEPLDLYLTNVDLDLIKDMYDIYFIEYVDGYKFKGKYHIFDEYIDYWNKIKMENSNGKGDTSLRTIAKLMLNNLYGKTASQVRTRRKIPYLKDNGVIGYETTDEEIKEPIYTAMASFITAYARDLTIRSAVKCFDTFVYADTDSLHLLANPDNKNKIEIHPVELGKFKHESSPTKARFLRAKTYIEEIDGKLEVKCAGMNPEIKKIITWDNFHYGFTSNLKQHPKNVKGGVIIEEIPFTISPPR